MRFLFRLIPYLLAAFTIGLFISIAIAPTLFAWFLLIFLIILGYTLWELLGRKLRNLDFWGSFGLLAALTGGSMGLFLTLEGNLQRVGLAVITSIFIGVFVEYLYRWFYGDGSVPATALVVITTLVELGTIFSVSATFIGLLTFLRAPPLWMLAPLFAVIVAAIGLVGQWHRGVVKANAWGACIVGLISGELFAAASYLPTDYLVDAIVITIAWYVCIGMMRMYEFGTFSRRSVYRYLALATSSVLLVAITARWV